MRKMLVFVAIAVLAGACTESKSKTDEACCGSMDMPPSKPLNPDQELQALALYNDFNIISSAAEQLPATPARIPKNKSEEAIQKMVQDNCELVETKTENGQTQNTVGAVRDLPGRTCPIEYIDKTSTTSRATSPKHTEAIGTASTKLRVISPELAALTSIDFWESAGGMKMDYVMKSETKALFSWSANQRGTLSYDGKTYATVLKMKLKMEMLNDAFHDGKATTAMGAQSEFGWLILKLEQTYKKGVKSHRCFLNGKDITTYPECSELDQSAVLTIQPALRPWNE